MAELAGLGVDWVGGVGLEEVLQVQSKWSGYLGRKALLLLTRRKHFLFICILFYKY